MPAIMTPANSPLSVLHAIARAIGCAYLDIEGCLEALNNASGMAPRPMARKVIAEERLDMIRAWLGTPEAESVIERAQDFVRRMKRL